MMEAIPCRTCQRPCFGASGFCTKCAPAHQTKMGDHLMKMANQRAEKMREGWSREAEGYLRSFAKAHSEPFLAEEIPPWAYERRCPMPPDDRAWGAIVKAAAKDGIIEQTGLAAKNKLSGHSSTWRPLWRSLT